MEKIFEEGKAAEKPIEKGEITRIEEAGEAAETKELKEGRRLEEEKLIREMITQEVAKMRQQPQLEEEAEEEARKMEKLKMENKLKKLLSLANEKGVVYSVLVAERMDDPYLLDRFHDIIVAKGIYSEQQRTN